MKYVIVTGISGAGKTVALKMLEDFGFYCVDNLPVALIADFVKLNTYSGRGTEPVALGIDIRSKEELTSLKDVFEKLDKDNISHKILFLDADDEALVKRYKQSRRMHPLAKNGRLENGIAEERTKLDFLRKRADFIIDTSRLLPRDLRHELSNIFVEEKGYSNLFVTILSFGFIYGIPDDTDLVFDVRFLPNPFYIEDLKMKSGEDSEVRDYVFSDGTGEEFLKKLVDMIQFLIPHYIAEGKNQLVIGIGCTGGQHRSVAVACELGKRLENTEGIGLNVEHRDIDKNKKRIG